MNCISILIRVSEKENRNFDLNFFFFLVFTFTVLFFTTISNILLKELNIDQDRNHIQLINNNNNYMMDSRHNRQQ